MSYEAITAWSGLLAALIAAYAVWTETRRHRFSMGIQLLLRLEEQFRAPRMRENRKAVATAYQKGELEEASNEVDEIIDFFEGVGFLVQNQALPKKATWSFFFSFLRRFYQIAKDYIDRERHKDPTIWTNFRRLYSDLLRLESRALRRQRDGVIPSERAIRDFVAEEADL